MKLLRITATLACIFLGISPVPSSASPRPRKCDKWFPAKGKSKAVVILAHGANLRPDKLDPFAEMLVLGGFDVFRPAFTGHCGPAELYHHATVAEWEADARLFYKEAKQRAGPKPLYLVAYSFSAPIFLSFAEELPFDRYVFLAPAFATHFWYPLVAFVARTFPSLTYESMNLPGYAVHPVSALQPLAALDEYMRRMRARREPETPSLIWIDPDDELVSSGGIEILAATRRHWRVEKISNSKSTLPKTYHHLIIDEASLGRETWGRVTKETAEFLKK